MAEEAEAQQPRDHERFNNIVALTIAVLATFLAVASIKAGNVTQAMEQASADRNNGWAWYQAVRVREDMGTYELAYLQRLARLQEPLATPAGPTAEAVRLAGEIKEQEAEIVRIRTRLHEVERTARKAEATHTSLSVFDDQYDLSSALIAIATSLLAMCILVKARWLYWFSLLPSLAGIGFGATAMLHYPINMPLLFAWLS